MPSSIPCLSLPNENTNAGSCCGRSGHGAGGNTARQPAAVSTFRCLSDVKKGISKRWPRSPPQADGGHLRSVATWVRDVFNQTTAIRVADDAEDNRNCACLIFQCLPGVKGVGDKNIRVPVDEFFRGGAQFIRVTRRPPAIINLNILAFRPTSLLETSSEGRDECWR